MPNRCEVPSLRKLCLQDVASSMVNITRCGLTWRNWVFNVGPSSDSLRLPSPLLEELATEILRFISSYITLKDIMLLVENIEIFGFSNFSSYLKTVDYDAIPRVVKMFLERNFAEMTRLEHLSICPSKFEDRIELFGECIAKMKNLRSVNVNSCSDSLIQVITENCPHVEEINFGWNDQVTSKSVPFLLKCRKLRNVSFNLSLTAPAYAQLIVGLPQLENISYYQELNKGLTEYLLTADGPFNHKKMDIDYISDENLSLIFLMFPKLQRIKLYCFNRVMDLTVLNSLKDLSELEIHDCLGENCLYKFLEIKGNDITVLHLHSISGLIPLDSLATSIGQYCLKLRNLKLSGLFTENNFLSLQPFKFKIQPFMNLERFGWDVYTDVVNYFEFILLHASNIRQITCGFVTHSAFINILKVNPMERLEELTVSRSNDFSMKTIEPLLESCKNLKLLKSCKGWPEITKKDIKALEEYIRCNNLDLSLK